MRKIGAIFCGIVILGFWAYLCLYARIAPTFARSAFNDGLVGISEYTYDGVWWAMEPLWAFMEDYRKRMWLSSTGMIIGFIGFWFCTRPSSGRVEKASDGNVVKPPGVERES